MKSDFMFTSESVTEGHPDKLCDQISDAIVDRFLSQAPYSRISAECAVAGGVVFIATHYASSAKVDVCELARSIINQVGYQEGEFNARDCTLMSSINQLPESRNLTTDPLLPDHLDRWVAQHQSSVFGYACRQTPVLMPLPIWLAHKVARRLAGVRLTGQMPYLEPDGKVQVGIEFRGRKPYRIHSIALITSQQEDGVPMNRLRDDVQGYILEPAFINEPLKPDTNTQLFINPENSFTGGGPAFHAGLTGRKNGVDTYGDFSRHGGAALSGKDPLRIDRVGAYAARHAAKNIVAAGLADECEVLLSYTIGLPEPASIHVETFGTGKRDDAELQKLIRRICDFRLGSIIRNFDLCHLPAKRKGNFYRLLAAYGHVGRMDIGLPWERTDLIDALRD